MGNILFYMLVEPIRLLLELVFSLMYRLFDNPGIAIVAVSLAVNFLILPMYKRSDAIQEEERAKQQAMSRWVKHIRRTFRGDERFMMLSAYYREQQYQPLYVIRGSLSLLLQIPFFIAAYTYLSHLAVLQGAAFGPIADLGRPDGLLRLGGMNINVLPVLMTLINLASGAIYTKNGMLKEKLQILGLALVFLVLLYTSPSGLVLYWTLNNSFSLLKNIFFKLIPNPHKVFALISAVFGLVMSVYLWQADKLDSGWTLFFELCFMALCLLPAFSYVRRRQGESDTGIAAAGKQSLTGTAAAAETDRKIFQCAPAEGSGSGTLRIFLLSVLLLTVLFGIVIPFTVIEPSPLEFVTSGRYVSPFQYLISSTAMAAGIFGVWGGVVYAFSGADLRRRWSLLMAVAAVIFSVNFIAFQPHFGNLSASLRYDEVLRYPLYLMLLNLALDVLLAAGLCRLYQRARRFFPYLIGVLLLSGSAFSVYCAVSTGAPLRNSSIVREAKSRRQDDKPILKLSTGGKNVVVIMLDRAIGAYLPYIMAEEPQLAEIFDGFTYYPNTLSFGTSTNFASPALFGGYEYTPARINERSNETLQSKQNEALRVMPVLFASHDFQTVVCDPPYAGYQWYPDLSIYDGYANISAYHTESGEYFHLLPREQQATLHPELLHRNFLFYGFTRALPLIAQAGVYDRGRYLSTTKVSMHEAFLNHFAFLSNMSRLTEVEENAQNHFLMIQNGTTHEPVILNPPDYLPADNLYSGRDESRTQNGRRMKIVNEVQARHFDTDIAALIQLGHWLDFLKQQGCYDNTRIIVVSDHGRKLGQFPDMLFLDMDVEFVNPLLMVKDFDSRGRLNTDERFMTNADVPALATDGVIDKPLNPFSGKLLSSAPKSEGKQLITMSEKYSVVTNNGNVFDTGDANWYAVDGNIFRQENWVKLGPDNAADKFGK